MLSITSSNINFTSQPRIGPITDSWKHPENAGLLPSKQHNLAAPMEAIGSVTFAGAGSAAGWTVGFMQAISVVEWAIYRGETAAQGSVLVQQRGGSAPASRTYFDAERTGTRYQRPIGVQTPLVSGTQSLPCATALPSRPTFPLTLEVALQDSPEVLQNIAVKNSRTGAGNKLSELRTELTLCAVLAAIDPAQNVHLLRGWIWTVLWQNKFIFHVGPPAVITSLPIGSGNRCTAGSIFIGAPTDPRFKTIFTVPPRGIFNIEYERASAKTRVETSEWTSFNVPR